MRKVFETAVILMGTLGWWGFVYPELCLTEGMYAQEAQAGQMENVRIKSRIAEYLFEESKGAERETALAALLAPDKDLRLDDK